MLAVGGRSWRWVGKLAVGGEVGGEKKFTDTAISRDSLRINSQRSGRKYKNKKLREKQYLLK